MDIPKYYELYKPLLQCLADGNVHALKEIKTRIAQHFGLTEAELAEPLPSGRQTYFANRVGWARTYLKKAGLLESPARGTFQITEEGRRVLQEDPQVLDNGYLMRYPSFKAFVGADVPGGEEEPSADAPEAETPDDALENAFKRINQSLADDLLAEVMKLSPVAFEKMVLDLMAKMGYGTPPSRRPLQATRESTASSWRISWGLI